MVATPVVKQSVLNVITDSKSAFQINIPILNPDGTQLDVSSGYVANAVILPSDAFGSTADQSIGVPAGGATIVLALGLITLKFPYEWAGTNLYSLKNKIEVSISSDSNATNSTCAKGTLQFVATSLTQPAN